jgi:peptidoglycan/xylan/chitin deacetylase (PgdA/CDA1 family)
MKGPMLGRLSGLAASIVLILTALVAAPAAHGSNITVISHGPRATHLIALTFDDGYDWEATAAIVRILHRHNVRATFFPIARYVSAHPHLWAHIANLGFAVGNHTISHRELAPLADAAVEQEICGARRIIERVTGHTNVHQFRPPYGEWDSRILRIAARCGYTRLVLWDVDPRDWSGISAAEIVRRATTGVGGSIVLLHAGPANTVTALPHIIRSYRSRGFNFVGIPRLVQG